MQGQIKLVVTAPSGVEKVVDLIGLGRIFDEALVFLAEPSPVSVHVVEAARLALFNRELVLAMIEQSRPFTLRLLAGLSQRLHHLLSDLEAYCLQSATQSG